MRRAKIVATLGPATNTYDTIRAIIEAGVDVARLNLSHGSYDVHEAVYAHVRKAAADVGKPVAVLVDLQGPKIRLGKFADGPHDLTKGDIFTITTEDIEGTKDICSTTFKGLPQDVAPGDMLLIDDGKIDLRVLETDGVRVRTEVLVGGAVSNNKGINLPGVAVNVPALSEKDEDDLRWGLRIGADYIALSFVRSADDLTRVNEIMTEEGRHVPVIAKIEKPQAVDAIVEIVDAFDAIMVARGDLGVELPLEQVPLVQKLAVEAARRMAKPVIVATQMLESMISSPVPTRAETSDVANAILDGADACMLSGETAIGEYPVEAVETMNRIMLFTEQLLKDQPYSGRAKAFDRVHPITSAVTHNAANIAESIGAKLVVVASRTGGTAWVKSKQRNFIPTLGVSNSEITLRRMCLFWGIMPLTVQNIDNPAQLIEEVGRWGRERGILAPGDHVVFVTGTGVMDHSHNLLVVHQVPADS